MLRKTILATVLALGAFGIASTACAQAQPSSSGLGLLPKADQSSRSLVGQLDQFTRNLLGLAATDEPSQRSLLDRALGGDSSHNSGTAAHGPATVRGSAMSNRKPTSASMRNGSRVVRSTGSSTTEAPKATGLDALLQSSAARLVPTSGTVSTASATVGAPAEPKDPMLQPLHERLEGFRESVFDNNRATSQPAPASTASPRVASSLTGLLPLPSGPTSLATAGTPHVAPSGAKPHLAAPPVGPTTALLNPSIAAEHTSPAEFATQSAITRSPTPATPPSDRTPTSAVPDRVPTPALAGRTPTPASIDTRPSDTVTPPLPTATAVEPTPSAVAADRGVLFSRKGPALSVETTGPRQITVGKESVYEVTIENRGEAVAEDVVVYVTLPSSADVAGTQVSTGAAQSAGTDQEPLRWDVGRLPAQGREKMQLRIVPRENRAFDLAVRWDYQPIASQAMIEVQEPKLTLEIDGPREVLYGEKAIYTLTLSNTGNGDAENAKVRLVPLGAGANQTVSHSLGRVGAGQKKRIEVELTARQVGELTLQVAVEADGGVRAELVESVVVRRAALQVDVEGPNVQYVGKVARYRVTVQNPGSAAAKNLTFTATLPPDAQYVSGIDGSQLDDDGGKVRWNLPILAPADRQSFTIECRLASPGTSRMDVACAAEGDLSASAGMTTRVEAVADLALEVLDPIGPIAVGRDATYQVRIRNRGTKDAPNVEVVAYFSDGIEPTAADGAPSKISTGQVVFSPIATVKAGEDLVLEITARAEVAGNHVFRAEVHCQSLDARLVSEDTTQFYQNEPVTRTAPQMATTGSALMPVPTASESRFPQSPAVTTPTTAERPTASPRR